MIKIDRYIRNTVFQSMLLVLLVLAGLDMLFTLFEELGETDDRYQSVDAVIYVLQTFPRHIYELLPMAALIGSLIGLGILASGNELVVMQTAGIKVNRIVWAVMKPAAVVMIAGLLLGEFIAPPLELKGEVDKAIASGEEVMLSRYGFWQRNGNEYVHFNAIDPDGILYGVTIYSFDDQRQLISNSFAQRAVYHEEATGAYWLLEDITETIFERKGEELNSYNSSYLTKSWDVDLSPDLLKVLIIDSDKMAISDLFRYATRFESQGQDAGQYFLSFWRKLLQPLTTAALVLVAISFVFGPLREATMGSRVFVAVCFGLLFTIFQRLLNTVSLVYQLNPFLAVIIPIAISGLIGLFLLRRAT